MSYRYIGRRTGSMDLDADGKEVVDNTVNVRHDFRNTMGGLMMAPLAISSPEGGGRSDLEVMPTPVIHYAEILDPGYDMARASRSARPTSTESANKWAIAAR